MNTTEEKYKDREITIRGRETCKLSDLTKEERDIYFSGFDKGGDRAMESFVFAIIAVNLRTLRYDKGWSQKKVAEKIFLSTSAYQQYEDAKCEPAIDTLLKIKKLYNLKSIEYLITERSYNHEKAIIRVPAHTRSVRDFRIPG
jgi:DNA-binding XRE family transcriptional regulator